MKISPGLAVFVAAIALAPPPPPPPPTQLFSETNLLSPGDATLDNVFGGDVAIDGDTAVVGASWDNVGGTQSGAAYVYVRSGGVWTEQQKLKATDLIESGAHFGTTVALQGDTIVIGSPQQDPTNISNDKGAAYVFVRSGGVWNIQGILTASDPGALEEFGNDVAIDGNTIIVGNRVNNEPGIPHSGAAYVYVRSAGVWSEQQKLLASDADENDFFGTSVAISGDTAIIGAPPDDGAAPEAGAIYVFTRSGGVWTQQQKLTAGDAAQGDNLGVSASISGDTVAIGATGAGSGAVYMFDRTGGVWSESQKLTVGDLSDLDWFGIDVTLSGDTLVVGASLADNEGANAGRAYAFVRDAGVWSLNQTLIPSDAGEHKDFGSGVSLSGDTLLVGAPHSDGSPMDPKTGLVHVFERDTVPPLIQSVTPSSSTLWPPNHKMVPITIVVTATDNSGEAPTCQIVSVSSNEPIDGLGDGDTFPDWGITGMLTLNLRAERGGSGNGRIYTITVECTDASSNVSTAFVNVVVPHSMK